MLIISHRGNLNGPHSSEENAPDVVDEVLDKGFSCEVDVWVTPQRELKLGHDKGEYLVDAGWFSARASKLWIHCKNMAALEYFCNSHPNFNFFWPQEDDHVLTSHGVIWSYPGQPVSSKGIVVLPELNMKSLDLDLTKALGICTDFPLKFDQELNGSSLRP